MTTKTVIVHCCDSCVRREGLTPKAPAESGTMSWLCQMCGHYGIGSKMECEVGEWLQLKPVQKGRKMIKTEYRPVYVTEDGTEFSDQEAANAYQKKLDLEYLVSHSDISFHDTNAAEVTEWIAEHYEQIKEILG